MVPEKLKENIPDIICFLFKFPGLLLMQIIIYQWRINIQDYMLDHPAPSQLSDALHISIMARKTRSDNIMS